MSAIVILGASALQRPLVRAARATGRTVVTVDNVPGNVAHRDAHHSHCVSTRDVEGVVALARRERACAVLTACSDVALPAVAAANEALGLPGFDAALLARWIRKDRLRAFQREHGIPHPAFVAGPASDALHRDAGKLGGSVIVKPTDRSGSRGVSRIEAAGGPALAEAIGLAAELSFRGEVVVERYVEGPELGGDAWVRDGRIEALFVTRKDMQGAIVRGHLRPAGLDARDEGALRETLAQHVGHAGYADGPLNFDVRMPPGGDPIVLELAPRLGGNWIPQLIAWTSGVDLFEATIRQALGEPVRLVSRPLRPAASFVLGSSRAGRLEAPIPVDRLRDTLPGLAELEIDLAPGDRFDAMRDSGQQVGRALFDLEHTRYAEAVDALEQALSPWLAPTRGSVALNDAGNLDGTRPAGDSGSVEGTRPAGAAGVAEAG